MAAALDHLKPGQARQARAALVMDSVDLTHAGTAVRDAYPEGPTTSLADLLR
jgi:hypothetical protein